MKILGAITGILVVVLVIFAVNAWAIMLLWGGIAGAIGAPTIGFGTAFLVALLFMFMGSGSTYAAARRSSV